jgi:phosphoglycerate kinase
MSSRQKLYDNDAKPLCSRVDQIPDGRKVMDAGPQALETWRKVIMDSKPSYGTGRPVYYEMPNFANGTLRLVGIMWPRLPATDPSRWYWRR